MTAALEGEVSGQQHAPAAVYPRERSGTHCTGGWVGPRAGLDGQKISSPPGFDPGQSSPYSVAIPTELPGPPYDILRVGKIIFLCILMILIQCLTYYQFLKNPAQWIELHNPLKFNGFCLYHQVQPHLDSTFCSHNVLKCPVSISEQTSIIPLYSLTDSFLQLGRNVFTVRYGLNL
jgi:hypothetical protein